MESAEGLGDPVANVVSPAESISSPCISVCRMDETTGLCEGCWRTLDEIVQWSSADDYAKRTILARIAQRTQERKT